jgi:hypothetical protein
MLTLKIVTEHSHWVPDLTEVTTVGGASIPGTDCDVVEEIRENNPGMMPTDGMVYHVVGSPTTGPWYAVAIQVRRNDGTWHTYCVPERCSYLLGPDGRTIDRI